MGGIRDSELRKPVEPVPEGTPQPVGHRAAREECTATSILRDGKGKWRFGPEVEIQVWPKAFLDVELPNGDSLLWTGVEVRTKARQWMHAELVTALYPYSHDWFDHAPFRPPRNSGGAEKMADLQKALDAEGTKGLAAALERLRFDPFTAVRSNPDGSRPFRYTARLTDFKRVWRHMGAPLGRGHVLARRSANYRHAGVAPEWRFGVCKDVERAVRELRDEAKASGDMLEVRNRPGGPHSAVGDEADRILDGAIWMALAGNRGDKLDQPVIDEVRAIAARTREYLDKRTRPGRPIEVSISDRDADPDSGFLEWEAVVELARKLGTRAIKDWEKLEEAPPWVLEEIDNIKSSEGPRLPAPAARR